MRKIVNKLFRRYGIPLALRRDGKEYAFRGFLQPAISVSQRSALKKMTPLGEIAGYTYMFIGPVDEPQLRVGDTLSDGQRDYDLRQAEIVMHQEEPVYLWGLCVQKGGADTWGS